MNESEIKSKKEMLISIVVPVYNEEKNIPVFYDKLENVLSAIEYNYEIIFIDDGSLDNSLLEIKKLVSEDNRLKYIEFSRNFGKEMATTAGINMCEGDACVVLDADLQHPVEFIPEFIEKWKGGAEVVVGVKKYEKGKNFFMKFCSSIFYKIMSKISETDLAPHSTDYKLLDRLVINEFNRLTEKNRMTRGLIAWLGFKKDFVYFIAEERENGKSRYGFLKLLRLALYTFASHSLLPLKLAGYLGILTTLFSGLFGLFILITQYFYNFWSLDFSGPAQLAVLIVFLIGIVLSCLGLIALYIGNIHTEVAGRPMYVIRSKKL